MATFYSHFGAISFKKICDGCEVGAKLMPVPRSLSSSCGTCVRYEGEEPFPDGKKYEDIEQVVEVRDGKYVPIYKNQ